MRCSATAFNTHRTWNMNEMQSCLETAEDLECPVCLEYMEAPIHQCQLGHGICRSCFLRVTICPLCRGPLSNVRNSRLERLLSRIVFPCKNRFEGCSETARVPRIRKHEINCSYIPVPCMFSNYVNCGWSGAVQAFLPHARVYHKDHLFENSDNEIVCADFVQDTSVINKRIFCAVFTDDGEIFKKVWDVDYRSMKMRWCVFHLSVRPVETQYLYDIRITHENMPAHDVSIRAHCLWYKHERDAFRTDHCMKTNYAVMKQYCDGIQLKYTINISKK